MYWNATIWNATINGSVKLSNSKTHTNIEFCNYLLANEEWWLLVNLYPNTLPYDKAITFISVFTGLVDRYMDLSNLDLYNNRPLFVREIKIDHFRWNITISSGRMSKTFIKCSMLKHKAEKSKINLYEGRKISLTDFLRLLSLTR